MKNHPLLSKKHWVNTNLPVPSWVPYTWARILVVFAFDSVHWSWRMRLTVKQSLKTVNWICEMALQDWPFQFFKTSRWNLSDIAILKSKCSTWNIPLVLVISTPCSSGVPGAVTHHLSTPTERLVAICHGASRIEAVKQHQQQSASNWMYTHWITLDTSTPPFK